MRGIKPCPHCGKEVATSADTCPHCGGRVKRRWLAWLLALAALPVGIVIYAENDWPSDTTPACADAGVKQKVVELENAGIRQLAAFAPALGTVQVHSLKSPRELYHNADSGFRACRAVAVRGDGEGEAGYTIEWRDKQNGLYWVQLVGAEDLERQYGQPPARQQAQEESRVRLAVDRREDAPAPKPTPEPADPNPLQKPDREPEPEQTRPPARAENADASWMADWGNDIQALVTMQACTDPEFLPQGYQYQVASSIPLARLKKPTDAWGVAGDRATTVVGCWFKKADGLLHLKMRRKKDNRIFEQDANLEDGSWAKLE